MWVIESLTECLCFIQTSLREWADSRAYILKRQGRRTTNMASKLQLAPATRQYRLDHNRMVLYGLMIARAGGRSIEVHHHSYCGAPRGVNLAVGAMRGPESFTGLLVFLPQKLQLEPAYQSGASAVSRVPSNAETGG